MLQLREDGTIHYIDSDSKTVLMDNRDIKNVLFNGIVLGEDFSYSSFFKILERYDYFSGIFEYAAPYLEEYLKIEPSEIKTQTHLPKMSVLSPCVSLIGEELSIMYRMEVYLKDVENSGVEEDISLMKMAQYINYNIGLNTLAHIVSQSDSDDLDYTYFNFNPNTHIPLIEFMNLVIYNISLHGYPFERDKVIQELEHSNKEDKEYLEEQANDIAEDILRSIQKGDK